MSLEDRAALLLRRFQGVGRAQNRYLFVLLLIATYSVATYLTPSDRVNVSALGISVDADVFHASVVTVLALLCLAFFGSWLEFGRVFLLLMVEHAKSKGAEEALDLRVYDLDEVPNVLDFLSYIGRARGPWVVPIRGLTGVLYAAPITAVVAWSVFLLASNFLRSPYDPTWVLLINLLNVFLLGITLLHWASFLRTCKLSMQDWVPPDGLKW